MDVELKVRHLPVTGLADITFRVQGRETVQEARAFLAEYLVERYLPRMAMLPSDWGSIRSSSTYGPNEEPALLSIEVTSEHMHYDADYYGRVGVSESDLTIEEEK
jgi:hypothetical protein